VTFTNEIVTDTLIARIKWGDGRVESYRRETNDEFTSFGSMTRVAFSEKSSQDGWTASLSNGVTYIFDTNGWLTAIDDGHSRSVALVRTTSGQLTQLTDTRGRSANFYYTNGFLASVSLPFAGYNVGFGYDSASNLTSITDMRGNTRHFTYDSDHRLTSDTDPRGILVVSNLYDTAGRVIEQIDVTGDSITYSYNTNYPTARMHTEVTGPGGLTVEHNYDYAFNVQSVVDPKDESASFSYDDNGNRTSIVDKNGQALNLKYDALNNPTSVVNALGAQSSATFDSKGYPTSTTDPQGNTTTISYYSSKRVFEVIDPTGAKTRFYYSDPDAPDSPSAVQDGRTNYWQFQYNADEQTTRMTDPRANYVNMTYDSMGRMASASVPGLPSEKAYFYYDAHGNVTSRVDALGRETRFTYDENDTLLTSTFVPSTSTTTYAYDPMYHLTNITDGIGGSTSYEYDQEGRLAAVTDADGVRVTMEYDDAGHLISNIDAGGRKTTYGYNALGQITAKTNHLGLSWQYEYDALGRLSAFEDPDGYRSTIVYDSLSRPIEVTDELGRTTYRQYDAIGRATNIISPDGGMTSYRYDANGNLLQLTTPTTQTWEFSYDKNNRLVTSQNPLTQTETYTYDARGNRTGKTDRDGSIYSYTYDLYDRPTSITLPGAGGVISNVYDAADNLIQVSHNGMTWSATYDKLGRKLSFTDANTNTLTYTYTTGSRLKTITYPGGKTVTNLYDAAGRISFIRDWAGNETVFAYDALNRMTNVTLPNDTTKSFTYDANNRVTALNHQRADNSLIHEYTYGHNAVGQITSRVEQSVGVLGSLTNETTSANYDAADRLLTIVRGGTTNSYWYDPRGNLVSNEVSGIAEHFTYDALNRLVISSNESTSLEYTYGPNGRIVSRSLNGTAYNYLGDGKHTYAKLDGNNNVIAYYIHAGPLAYALDASNDMLVYHLDGRGSVTEITDDGESVVQSYAYSPYGRVLSSSGTLTNEFQFIGGHGTMREESGLSQMGARFYDPDAGRFITEDPIGLAAGANVYAYVSGDPVNQIDPSGLSAWIQDWIFNEALMKALDTWWDQGYVLRDAGSLTIDEPIVVQGQTLTKELVDEYVMYSYTDAEKDARIVQDFKTVDKIRYGHSRVFSPIEKAVPLGKSTPPPPMQFGRTKDFFKNFYKGIRNKARVIWGSMSATAYGIYTLGSMDVTFIIAEGSASIIGTTVAVLIVEGVVVYVVTTEVAEATGINETVQDDMSLALETIFYAPDNLIDMDKYNQVKWNEYERLNQKVQKIDGIIEEIKSTPGYDGIMSLENPYAQ